MPPLLRLVRPKLSSCTPFPMSILTVSSLASSLDSSPTYETAESSTTIAPVRQLSAKQRGANLRENVVMSYGSSSSPKPECNVSATEEPMQPVGARGRCCSARSNVRRGG